MSNSLSFKPHPYTFNLIDCFDHPMIVEGKFKDKIIAQCPPFHVLLDHTIAVLWTLFSSEEQCGLRSSQIGWALKFLEGMHNDLRANFYSEDVKKAIQYLECALVHCISSEKIEFPREDKVKDPPKDDEEGAATDSNVPSYPLANKCDNNEIQSLLLRDMLKGQ